MKISGAFSAALAASIVFAAVALPAHSAEVSRKEPAAKDLIRPRRTSNLCWRHIRGSLATTTSLSSTGIGRRIKSSIGRRDSVKEFVQKMGMQNWPKFKVNFLRVAADGDLVFLQTVQPKTDKTQETVIVDIFRVENDKIVEHWDTMQAVPSDASNKRAMY